MHNPTRRPGGWRRTAAVALTTALVLVLSACDQAHVTWVSGYFPNPTAPQPLLLSGDLSSDGGVVVFDSTRAFDPNDQNGHADIIVNDRNQQLLLRVSTTPSGAGPDQPSEDPMVSGNGRYVTWTSAATDIVPGDTNGVEDVFRADLLTGAVIRVSVGAGGVQGNGISHDAAMSANGRYVVFRSGASNLVAGDTNGVRDVFVRDVVAGTTTRWSVAADGSERAETSFDPEISADGRVVVFASTAPFLGGSAGAHPDIYRKEATGAITRLSDTNGGDRSNGRNDQPVTNDDGSVVAWESEATNLDATDTNGVFDVYVWSDGKSERASFLPGNLPLTARAYHPRIDESGELIGFYTDTDPGAASAFDGFVRNRTTDETHLVTSSANGTAGPGFDTVAAISGDGRAVLVRSGANGLVPEDQNNATDLFIKSFPFPKVTGVSPATLAPGSSTLVTIDGRGFAGPMTVTADPNAGGNLTIGAVTIVSPTRIRVQITVPAGATAMTHDLTVTNQGVFPDDTPGAFTVCRDCLTVS